TSTPASASISSAGTCVVAATRISCTANRGDAITCRTSCRPASTDSATPATTSSALPRTPPPAPPPPPPPPHGHGHRRAREFHAPISPPPEPAALRRRAVDDH